MDIRQNNYAVLGHFGPFWAVLGHFMSQILQNLFSENKNVRFWDIRYPRIDYVAPPENGKTFKLKIRMPQKGTCLRPHWRRLHPLKTRKVFFRKQECPKKRQ